MSEEFEFLWDFLNNRMRMRHIYQPVMLMRLLEDGGHCFTSDIAKAILMHDPSQVEYYEKITGRMPGRVLREHKVVSYRNGTYSIPNYGKLTSDEKEKLIQTCAKKLNDFLERRTSNIWKHRRTSSGYISGSKKYEVLKRAWGRCELCGISDKEKALEVDHIVPSTRSSQELIG